MKTTKRFLSLILCAALLFVTVPLGTFTVSSEVVSGSCDGSFTWEYDTQTHTLTITGNDVMTCSDIPWVDFAGSIHHVVINSGVTSVGACAFSGCSELTDVSIPDTVTDICDFAFCGCSKLTDVTIPGGVWRIGQSAFEWCSGLTSIVIPDSVTDIYGSAFRGCTGLKSLTVGKNVSTIGQGAFDQCTGLIEIYWKANMSYSNGSYFLEAGSCGEGITLIIDDGVETIPDYVFSICTGLKKVVIPNSVTQIGSSAFSVTGLTEVVIPDSVTVICDGAFSNCSALKSITVGENVSSIGNYVFSYCTALTEINWNAKSPYGGMDAFYSCDSDDIKLTFGDSVERIPGVFGGLAGLKEVVIPDSVTEIDDGAFYGCTGLKSLTVGKNVSVIRNAFGQCSALTEIHWNVTSQNTAWPDIFLGGEGDFSNVNTVTIGDNVESIPNSLFSNFYGLKKIVIPDSVTQIGSYAFANAGLTEVVIPDSVTEIGEYAFSNCSNLKSISIGKNVNSIGRGAFDLSGLTDIYWNARSASTQGDSWEGLFSHIGYGEDVTVTFGDDVEWIPDCLFSYCTGLKTLVLGNSVTRIGRRAFANTGLTEVVIPNSVIQIGESAFEECSSLEKVTVNGNTLEIGMRAFASCAGLTEIHWNALSLSSVGNDVFANYSGDSAELTVTFGEEVETIPHNIFSSCRNLKKLVIPNHITGIGSYAFGGCSELTSILIPKSVISIDSYAFGGCDNLTIRCYKDSYAMDYAIENSIPYEILGDVSANGIVDGDDLVVLQSALLNNTAYEEAFDINGDGVLDVRDLVRLKKYLADNSVALGE